MTKPVEVKRGQRIGPEMIGGFHRVHNGKSWVKIRPIEAMIGLKFGELVKTRTPRRTGKKKGKKR